MTNLITVTNCESGETIERQMTANELLQFDAIKAEQAQQAKAQAQAKAAKAAALAKLEALGLSPDDLKALGL